MHSYISARGRITDCFPYWLEPSVSSNNLVNSCIPLFVVKYKKIGPHHKVTFSRSIVRTVHSESLIAFFLVFFFLERVGVWVTCVSFMPVKCYLKLLHYLYQHSFQPLQIFISPKMLLYKLLWGPCCPVFSGVLGLTEISFFFLGKAWLFADFWGSVFKVFFPLFI